MMEEWKGGRMEGWKNGRVECWIPDYLPPGLCPHRTEMEHWKNEKMDAGAVAGVVTCNPGGSETERNGGRWKIGRVEEWKGGRMEGWNDGCRITSRPGLCPHRTEMEHWKNGKMDAGAIAGVVTCKPGGSETERNGGMMEHWNGGRMEGWNDGCRIASRPGLGPHRTESRMGRC